jgi:hypothetical protein|tara:strand:- start:204 stop:542 length:339 start_codon:yes stop_codon:yes gene_type:complete
MVNKQESSKSLEEQLLEAKAEIIELKASTKTTLSGGQFLTIVMLGPLFLAFVALGVIIVFKVTSKPAEVAPHLDVILLALSIFANPVSAASGVIVGLMSDEIKAKISNKSEE